ncbi:MAG: leucine-rich repeat domain-containing protein [Clostridiales bacterium]|nr:leucine-rich repeat domain-containing protein [Clostridiales bacterium]
MAQFEMEYGVITSVVIGTNVTAIIDKAFWDCKTIETIYLSDSVVSIGRDAFTGCVRLEVINIPNSVTEIGEGAFEYCALKSIEFPNQLESMATCLLDRCNDLQYLFIPRSVKSIGRAAIGGDNLLRVVFEGTIEYIDAFYLHWYPKLSQLVFLEEPPIDYGGNPNDLEAFGMTFYRDPLPTIYVLNRYRVLWFPNGETAWNGCPLVFIDDISEVPPPPDINGVFAP